MVADKKAREAVGGGQPSGSRRKRSGTSTEAHVAGALRTAYEETVREDVPAEFLDLLGKLA